MESEDWPNLSIPPFVGEEALRALAAIATRSRIREGELVDALHDQERQLAIYEMAGRALARKVVRMEDKDGVHPEIEEETIWREIVALCVQVEDGEMPF